MRFKEIDINIKALPDDGDEELLKQLFGAKGVTVSDADDGEADSNPENPGKVETDDPNTVASVYPLQQELEMKKQEAGKDLAQFDNIAISFSGAEDVVLVDMAIKIRKDIQVFSLDTGRLHPETYQFIERVRDHYGITIETLFPDAAQVQALVREKGLFSFYRDDHKECCGIRKIGPLRNKLLTLDAWITGQRRDQSPGTRAAIPVIQDDRAFARRGDTLTKFNPLANWTTGMAARVPGLCPLQPPPRPGLHQYRLRALHPPRGARPA